MQLRLQSVPLRRLLIAPSVVVLVLSNVVIAAVFFLAAFTAVRQSIGDIQQQTADRIVVKLDNYLDSAIQLNQRNQIHLSQGVVDITDSDLRARFFSGQLRSNPFAAMSFIGTPSGEFYGARRVVSGDIEVVENNAGTGGASRYYRALPDGRMGEFVVAFANFDPRVRPWYRAAEASGRAVFSPVYRHFVFLDLALTASLPHYSPSGELVGVFGVDFLLDRIGIFLRESLRIEGTVVYVVERATGQLIANSELHPNFAVDGAGAMTRFGPDQLDGPIRSTWEALAGSETGAVIAGGFIIQAVPYRNLNVDWIIVNALPANAFLGRIYRTAQSTLVIFIVVLGLFLWAAARTVTTILAPVAALVDAAGRVGRRDWDVHVDVDGSNEIAVLAKAFSLMTDEIRGLVQGLEDRVQERTAALQAANSTKERFISIIAHDLRGPLHAMNSVTVDLVANHATMDPEDLAEMLRVLNSSTASVLHLSENLLLWGREKQATMTFAPEPADLGTLLQEAIQGFGGWTQQKGIHCSCRIVAAPATVDRQMMSTVLRNLLSNAIKYTPRDGQITGGVVAVGHEWEVFVEDTGVGMSAELIERITRIDDKTSLRGTEGETGSGLGMVLISDFLRRHGSQLEIRSTPGAGSRFSFRLPRLQTA